jgi:2-keto-3-deoxy-L-rhamnonate aldolase RhmA
VRLGRSGEIVSIAKTSGHDFIFIDTQHALYSLETIGHMAQAGLGAGIATLVRVPNSDDPDIGKLLDCGVSGIVVSDVSNAEQARKAVKAVRFPPRGTRSVQSTYSLTRYQSFETGALTAAIERQTLLACMIETVEAVHNMDAIAAVDGIDVLHLGCTDLLADMGRPGRFDDPEMHAIAHRLISVCQDSGKFAGIGGERDIERLAGYFSQGLKFHTTQTDITYLISAASQRVSALRQAAEMRI